MIENAIVTHKQRIPKVWIIYCREDEPAAAECYEQLRHWGYNAQMDRTTILPGQRGRECVLKSIQVSDAIIVLLSRHSLRKKRVFHWELRRAIEKSKKFEDFDVFLIPLRLEPCPVPIELENLHCLDWFHNDDLYDLVPALGNVLRRISKPWLRANGPATKIPPQGGQFEAENSDNDRCLSAGF